MRKNNSNNLMNETNNSSFILVRADNFTELCDEVKNLRNELSTIQVGDKYWYTQSDIDQFLENNYFAAYGVA